MQLQVEGFRLSRQQERLWLLQRDTPAYRSQCAILIEGSLEEAALREAFRRVIDRHEILRTAFRCPPGLELPLQTLVDSGSPSWHHTDVSDCSTQEQEARIDEIFDHEGQFGFDFEHDKLLRLHLLTLSSRRHVLIVTLPSLCADRKTISSLVDEISRCYAPLVHGDVLSDEPQQYADFSEWENELLEDPDAEAGKEFWRQHDYASGFTTSLPFEFRSLTESRFKPECIKSTIGAGLAGRIASVAIKYQTSSANVLLACWQTLMWRLTGLPEIVAGNLCDGRKNDELNGAFGLFAKFLPIRCSFKEGLPFDALLERITQATQTAEDWQEYFTWEHNAGTARSCKEPAFSIAFEYEEPHRTCSAADLTFSIYKQYVCFDRFKVKLCCVEQDDALLTEFYYDSGAVTAEAIKYLVGQFTTLLESVVSNPEASIDELEVVSDSERRKLITEFNQPKREGSLSACIHELFEAQTARTPDETAVVFEDERLSYRELNARANQLAHYLVGLGVGREVLVALCVERSSELVVGMLAILKAGAAYVPLDMAQPKERLRYMLEDARLQVVITRSELAGELPETGARVVYLDTEQEKIAGEQTDNIDSLTTGANLAYVIFTSGSTGRPKGVGVEHRQLANYVEAISSRFGFAAGESYAIVSTFAADLGHTMTFPSLCLGGALHIISQALARDPAALSSYFEQHAIDNLKIVPSHLDALMSGASSSYALPYKRLVLGGESTNEALLEKVRNAAPGCDIYNHYGPTETTVGVITHDLTVEPGEVVSNFVPLGRPIPNTEIYLLDSRQCLAPVGAIAELYIGGDGVTRGYLNHPELTADRFVPNPFGVEPGARLYKTGDLACYRPHGLIDFRGRSDNQVKFHGFRVELDEITRALVQHPQVRKSVVVVRGDRNGNDLIVAYYVSRQKLDSSELREHLAKSIIEETLPNVYVHMKKLPLTLNGKINYDALPTLEEIKERFDQAHVAPRTPAEQSIADIYCEILGVERVSVNDNFFELGGHSLLAIRVMSRIHEVFGVNLPFQTFFQKPTIAGLAVVVTQLQLDEQDESDFASMLEELNHLPSSDPCSL
ncbi:MAG TPA: amino acid adenylation domain-containing protein [Pyrinomonadaceae bacterium]|nr:amino acid adenylation domain-containing protein [Pyrinomonadaceae bacterium]